MWRVWKQEQKQDERGNWQKGVPKLIIEGTDIDELRRQFEIALSGGEPHGISMNQRF